MGHRYGHKSQHFVPKTYLAAWCDPTAPTQMEPYIWIFDRNDRTGRRKAPQNVFEETDFYTVRSNDGARNLSLEHGLQELEERFADIRRSKLAVEEPVNEEEHAHLVAFAVAMSFRTKAHREFRRNQWNGVVEAMRRLAAERGPRGERPEVRFSGSPDPSQPSLSLEDVMKLAESPIQYMMAGEIGAYIPVLGKLRVQIMQTDDPLGFITCDDPCVWMTADGVRRRPPPLNDLGEHFGLFMPLSPRQMLFLNPYESLYGRIPDRFVTWLNGQTWRGTYEYFVVRRNKVREEWFAAERDISEV